MNGLTTAAMDGPMRGGESRANFSIREAENGFIASAHVNSQIPFKRSGREGDGAYYDHHYVNGTSGEFVFPTLEEAFKEAENILNLAKTALQAEEARVKEIMGAPSQG